MESKNSETIIEGRIGLGVTEGSHGNTHLADDEDFKALKIEAKRVDRKRLGIYVKQ